MKGSGTPTFRSSDGDKGLDVYTANTRKWKRSTQFRMRDSLDKFDEFEEEVAMSSIQTVMQIAIERARSRRRIRKLYLALGASLVLNCWLIAILPKARQ